MNFWNNLFLNGIRKFPYGSIEIEWPNGKIEKIFATKNGPKANLKIADENVVKEIISGGSVKFAELYMAKRLTSSNLTALMHYFALNNDEAEDTFKVSILKYFFNKFSHFKNKKKKKQTKKKTISNELFSSCLYSLLYSSMLLLR